MTEVNGRDMWTLIGWIVDRPKRMNPETREQQALLLDRTPKTCMYGVATMDGSLGEGVSHAWHLFQSHSSGLG